MQNYIIKTAQKQDIKNIFTSWCKEEQWNPGVNDGPHIWDSDPQGFQVGYLNNEPIAICSAVKYSEQYGFIGHYICKPQFRGKGYGLPLFKACEQHLNPNGIIGLDGVLVQQKNYAKSGYKAVYRTIRYQGNGDEKEFNDSRLVPLSEVDFDKIIKYDRLTFPTDRSKFLKNWFAIPESYSLAFVEDGVLKGYGVLRKSDKGYRVGPLLADNEDVAKIILDHFISKTGKDSTIAIEYPEINKKAEKLIKSYDMSQSFVCIRMYKNGIPKTEDQKVFGILAYEFG